MEVARWTFTGEYDQHNRLVGGAAFCQQCRKKTHDLGIRLGKRFPEGTCYYNKSVDGPEGCVQPCPDISLGNRAVWSLFKASSTAINYAGMAGVPVGHDMKAVEAAARALGIPWDEATHSKFMLIEQAWLDQLARERERNEKG